MIALNSAIAIYAVKDINSTLEQRISNATQDLRRANQHLQSIDTSKDDFLSMASHQLRTPLTSIKGYISMVIDGDAGEINEQQQKFLTEAFLSSDRMVRVVNDFLNVSRLQTGKFVLDKTKENLAEMVCHEADILRQTAKTRDLKLKLSIDKNTPSIEADHGKLRQVVMNMIDNAIYYSPANTTIEVSLKNKKDRVEFTVKDQGIGVPKEEQAELFTKFYRAANARKQRPDGTGVGLYLAKKIINTHNGGIIFSSKEKQGSTFGFWLPKK